MFRIMLDRRGSAAVEFALLMPMLMVLLLGLADVVTRTSRTLQVESAARAGASYARHHGYDARAIARAAGSGLITLRDVRTAPRLLHGCLLRDGRIQTAVKQCPAGGTPGAYVEIEVSAASRPLLLRSKKLMSDRVSGHALVRID